MKTYNDSREFPLYNFERIETTGNHFYMLKGYEDGDDTEVGISELEEKYKEVVQDYIVSINSKNYDISQYGKINSAKMGLIKFSILHDVIQLKLKIKELGGNTSTSDIDELLKHFRMQKTEDLDKQLQIIKKKIDKLQIDIAEAVKNLEKNMPEKAEESDINSSITNVELILERGINMRDVSLYRFGLMQEQARKKIESISRENRR